MIKLLAVDMDGTCLDSKGRMSEKTFNALKAAAENGVVVVPATGRNTNCLPVRIKNEDFYRYVVSSNGSLVVDVRTDEVIFSSLIDNKTAQEIASAFRRHPVLVASHIDRDYYTQGLIMYCGVRHVLGDDAPKVVLVGNMERYLKKSGKSIEEYQLFYRGEKYRDIINKILEPYPEICAAHSKGYAEIYNKSGSKGTALLALGKSLGFTADEIACVGDEENDISMFDMVGRRFAMGNAIEEIKKRADVILPTNDEDGVAEAVRIILEERKLTGEVL